MSVMTGWKMAGAIDPVARVAVMHHQELGDALAERAAIRYRLEPDPILRAGEVQFVFGRAIYLPGHDEQPVFQIQVAMDKEKGKGATGERSRRSIPASG